MTEVSVNVTPSNGGEVAYHDERLTALHRQRQENLVRGDHGLRV